MTVSAILSAGLIQRPAVHGLRKMVGYGREVGVLWLSPGVAPHALTGAGKGYGKN